MILMYNYSDLSKHISKKSVKTYVEKQRRDRINKSLGELKDLIASTDERVRYQKYEKAEILEMTVNYIRNLKQIINNYEKYSFETWKQIQLLKNIYPYQHQRIKQKYLQIIIDNSSLDHLSTYSQNSSATQLWKPYI
ncbi:unnamed protein product [Adineta steineri]|uniref:BHLH domain-containing protein n=1 Tax=Adineta steineri TaxID=433720 RepID=A0A814WN73_9BILA|nr:unnamed protein product [Adineta steineri]CAF1591047.1 unnamed protein product [Adineta steineri]